LTPSCTTICTAGNNKQCQLYFPGRYSNGISITGTAYFYPGLYYISSSDTNGFQLSGSASHMPTECISALDPTTYDPSDVDYGNGGMLLFNAGSGTFYSQNTNAIGNFIGARGDLSTSHYQGVFFWESRSVGVAAEHTFGGGSAFTVQGTLYASRPNPTNTIYQTIQLKGGSGSATRIIGEVVTNVLSLGGNSGINMTLNRALVPNQRQVALVK
jgi:hypothetical protein